MQIAIASDHAGFEYKTRLKFYLLESGYVVEDFGTFCEGAVDYPLVIRPLALAVANGDYDRGIVLGGSGNGEAIVANRVRGVRCTLCWDLRSAQLARQHNDANVLSLGQRLLDFDDARAIVECWLETPFEGGRHEKRIRLIDRHDLKSDEAPHNSLPHRTDMVEETPFVCGACRQEFLVPVDMSAGSEQEFVEECPVCSYENAVFLKFDEEGALTVHSDHRFGD